MKLFKILLLSFILWGCESESIVAQDLRENVIVENAVFKVWYNEVKEQPVKLIYTSTNRPKNVDRGSMDFHKEPIVHTSDKHDYSDNPYDKGHMAPAAAFNCSRDMVKATFSYLNCALQHQSLNRGPWRELEEFERNLAKIYDKVNVTVECHFSKDSKVLPTGATVPDGFTKTIIWDDREECFYFPNKDVKGVNWIEFRIKLVFPSKTLLP